MPKSIFATVLFLLFSAIFGGIIGLFSAKFFIPKDVGLAGGAMVLFYGLIGLVVGLIIALIFRTRISKTWITRLNIAFAIVTITFGIWIYQEIRKSKKEVIETPNIPLQPSAPAQELR